MSCIQGVLVLIVGILTSVDLKLDLFQDVLVTMMGIVTLDKMSIIQDKMVALSSIKITCLKAILTLDILRTLDSPEMVTVLTSGTTHIQGVLTSGTAHVQDILTSVMTHI